MTNIEMARKVTRHYAAVAVVLVILFQSNEAAVCPTGCECNIRDLYNHVTCVNQALSTVPKNIPNSVTHLDLRDNHISDTSLSNVFQEFTELQYVDLSFNNLLTFDSSWFQNCENLVSVNLSNNNITHMVFDGSTILTSLNHLSLANNSITTLNMSLSTALEHVEKLDLHGNQISTLTTSEDFLFNENLINLDLRDNQIRELSSNVFSNLENLITLDLSQNQLDNLDGSVFAINSSLQTFDLSYNDINSIDNLTLPTLLTLNLTRNNITDLRQIEFQHLGNLTVLILDRNPISVIQTPAFESLTQLRQLSMSSMLDLSYLYKGTFSGLMNLDELILSHNPSLSFIHKDLFIPLKSISIIDLSYNSITTLHNETLNESVQLTSLVVVGNKFICDCELEWLIQSIQTNESITKDSKKLECTTRYSKNKSLIYNIDTNLLHCSEVIIVNYTADSAFKIGKPAILQCVAESVPAPEIIWITPRKQVFRYHNFHELAAMEYVHSKEQALHEALKNEDKSYYELSESPSDRMRVLNDGSLFIEFVMRSDGGPYKCIAKNPKNSTEVVINVTLDYAVLNEVKIWSLVVGFACAGSFFLLNLTYSLIHAAVRRCVSQSRRERIREVLESMDQYKKAHLARIKENYNTQVGRIRDQYHYQLGRLREHHQNQTSRMGRMREGASQKVEKLRENYNNQLGRLKDYSSSQLEQLREKYNSQVDKIKDYGSDKYDKLHEKYKLKQQHVLKLLEMMNLENCRTVFDSECVRTESMILHSEVFTVDDPALHSPIDSVSVSDSEYVTATSSETSKYSSRENVNTPLTDSKSNSDSEIPMNPYLPDDPNDADDDDNDNNKMKQLMSPDDDGNQVASTSSGKQRKYRRKHSKSHGRKKDTYPNFNPEDLEKLYKEFCDKKIDINELTKSIQSYSQKPGVWYTNVEEKVDDTEPSPSSTNKEHDEPNEETPTDSKSDTKSGVDYSDFGAQHNGATGGVKERKNSKRKGDKRVEQRHSKSYLEPKTTNYNVDDVNIEIPDEYFDSWTIKESVV